MIGIDIGTSTVKLCQVEKREKGYHIISALMASNPMQSGAKQNSELVRVIKAMTSQAPLVLKKTAASIGGTQILARNLTLPQMSSAELKGAVRFEAEQSVSTDIDSMYNDFLSLAREGDEKIDVLFVGVPKEAADRQLQLLKASGLEADIMDIDNVALANCYLTFDPNALEESTILLDIGHASTNISIIDDGMLRFVRNVDFGGKHITDEIAQSFGIKTAAAEKLKKRPDLWGESGLNIKNVLRKSMPDALEAVYRSMDYCMSRKKLLNVDKILLTGGSSSLHGLKKFVSEVFGIYTEIWNPLDYMNVRGSVQRDRGQFLGVALGLAIREEKHV